jgi:hypothetical protein
MVDHKSIFLWVTNSFLTIFGLITLNTLAIVVGILAGVTTITWNVVNTYFRIKQGKKEKNNGDRDDE